MQSGSEGLSQLQHSQWAWWLQPVAAPLSLPSLASVPPQRAPPRHPGTTDHNQASRAQGFLPGKHDLGFLSSLVASENTSLMTLTSWSPWVLSHCPGLQPPRCDRSRLAPSLAGLCSLFQLRLSPLSFQAVIKRAALLSVNTPLSPVWRTLPAPFFP